MATNEPKVFPQVQLALGESNQFVRDIQRGLQIVENGVFDFLTMCHVIVHKYQHGLDHTDPTVDRVTWNSIVNKGVDVGTATTAAPQAPTAAPAGIVGVGAATPAPAVTAAPAAPPTAAPTPVPTPPPNMAEQIPPVEHGTERQDQPSITAAEQAVAGNSTVGDPYIPYTAPDTTTP